MRNILSSMVLIAMTSPVFAQTTPDDMRTMAYAGDYLAIEAALAQAHTQSLSGQISFDDLRDLVETITTSHPTILATTDDWVEALPTSPYANALRAFQYRTIGWNLRGGGVARNIPRDALQSFGDFQIAAMEHAVKAYEVAPDYVPASDAIFRLQPATKFFQRDDYLAILENVLTIAPNIGSLKRSADFTQTGWGGQGQSDIIYLCEEHAAKVPDPTYDVGVCIVHLNGASASAREQAAGWSQLGDKHHSTLDWVRAWRLTASRERPRTAEDNAIMEEYLKGPGATDYDMAWRYMSSFPQSDDMDALVLNVVQTAKNEARENIAHDPYNPSLIDVLLNNPTIFGLVDYDFDRDFYHPNNPILLSRMAVAKPFHASSWSAAASSLSSWPQDSYSLIADPYFANSIYYSGHSLTTLENMLRYRFDVYLSAALAAFQGEVIASDVATMHQTWTCPIVRLSRLIDHQCRQEGMGPETCPESLLQFRPQYRLIVNNAIAQNLCEAEQTGTIADLRFSPTPVNLEELAKPLVFEE